MKTVKLLFRLIVINVIEIIQVAVAPLELTEENLKIYSIVACKLLPVVILQTVANVVFICILYY